MARILVVDDSLDTLHLVTATFESAGHSVVGVSDPLTAISMLRSEAVDAAVLDIMMPGLSGWELLESIRREPGHERTPIVFLSAIGDSGNRTRGIRLGADDFLAKPFDPEQLLVRLESLIARVSPPAAGLQGSLDSHSLAEVLQSLEQNSKTGTLEVVAAGKKASVLFAAGKIASAEFAGYQDRAAVLALLDHDRGHFRFVPGPVEVGRSRLEPAALLIEGAWIEDELASRIALVPSLNHALRMSGTVPPLPEGLKGLPIQEVAWILESAAGGTLGTLLEDRRFPPAMIRLTVAWLIEIGAVEADSSAVGKEITARSVARYVAAAPPLQPHQPSEIALIVHAPAWEGVGPMLDSLPAAILDGGDRDPREAIRQQGGGSITLRDGDSALRLTVDTFHNPEGAIAGEALANSSSIVLWVSEELTFEGLERLLRDLEATAPSRSRLLVVGALGALARGPRWAALPSAPESLEELLYELTEAWS